MKYILYTYSKSNPISKKIKVKGNALGLPKACSYFIYLEIYPAR